MILDPIIIIKTAGLAGIAAILFAETGLFFGFFLPGDSLLFASGIFASQGILPIIPLIIVASVACIVGDSVGYWSGKNWGRKLFERKASFFFKKERIYDAEHFYQKHGSITIVLARFMPIIRTFAPVVAGIADMNYRKFILYNIAGGFLWALSLSLLGYFFGGLIPNVDKYILPVILVIIIFSFLPFILKLFKHVFFKNTK